MAGYKKHTLESCKEIASKFKSLTSWKNANSNSYFFALRNGFLKDCCENFSSTEKIKTKKRVSGFKKISKRELEVLKLLLEECKNNEIAKKLNISEKTVGTFKVRLLEKTNSKTIIGLYKFNLQHKLVVLEN